MKGVVFVQFGDFVEELWGIEFWDQVLDEVKPESGGIYTSVGTYDDDELFALVGYICEQKAMTLADAQRAFGEWVFEKLYSIAPPGAHEFKDTFEFLHGVQDVIHIEVKKLNPDALLPEFEFLEESENHLLLHYISPRKMNYFCEGIIYGLGKFTGENLTISHVEDIHQGDARCVLKVERHD